MTNQRILQIIKEETAHQEGLIFEGMTYVRGKGYRNNQLIEVHGPNGKQLLTEADGAIDTFQKALSWAGFIPVVGDAIDAINALIYFIRKMFWDGMFSTIAIIPVVGTGISKVLKVIYNAVGKPLVNIIKKITTNGKAGAKAFFDLYTKASSKLQTIIQPIFKKIKNGASQITKFLNMINLSAINKKIMDYTAGWVALPGWIVKGLDGIVSQLKTFFAHMSQPPASVLHVTQKKLERTVHHALLPHEKEAAEKLYNDPNSKVDKEKYKTLEKFLEAQLKLRNKKASNLVKQDAANTMKELGEVLTKKGIQMVANLLKKSGNEIKLWSPHTAIVKLVQQAVGVKPDGTFGTDTENAVKKVQRKHGLAQDGVVGADTWAKIT